MYIEDTQYIYIYWVGISNRAVPWVPCIFRHPNKGKQSLVGFGFFVQWHINVRGVFNAKATFLEEQYATI